MGKTIYKMCIGNTYREFIFPSLSGELLIKAIQLLQANAEVKNVAIASGMRMTDFIISFRKLTGFSPRQYKIQLLQGKKS